MDGLAFGAFCEAIEKPVSRELGYKDTWSKYSVLGENCIWSRSPSRITVWLVLHRTLVHPYMWGKEDRHQLMVRIDPKPPSQCEMWVMVSVNLPETIPATPVQNVAPTLAVSPVHTKPAPQSSHSSSAGAKETPTPASVKLRASVSAAAQASATNRDLVRRQSPSKHRKRFQLKSLTEAEDNRKINTAGVVVTVLKEGHIAKNGIVYDILMVTSPKMILSTSPQTHMYVKVFHNDGGAWPEGLKLQRGQVFMLQELHVSILEIWVMNEEV